MATKKAVSKKAVSKKAVSKKAASGSPTKRKAAAPKKGSVADSWAEGYRPLIEACREHFGFLVRDHGFAEPEVKIDPPSAMITFRRGTDFVRLESEYVGEPFTAVHAGEGEPFGLATIMAELAPDHAATKPTPVGSVLKPEEMRAMVAHQAAFVARHPEVLRGDPALLARFKAREVAMRSASS